MEGVVVETNGFTGPGDFLRKMFSWRLRDVLRPGVVVVVETAGTVAVLVAVLVSLDCAVVDGAGWSREAAAATCASMSTTSGFGGVMTVSLAIFRSSKTDMSRSIYSFSAAKRFSSAFFASRAVISNSEAAIGSVSAIVRRIAAKEGKKKGKKGVDGHMDEYRKRKAREKL